MFICLYVNNLPGSAISVDDIDEDGSPSILMNSYFEDDEYIDHYDSEEGGDGGGYRDWSMEEEEEEALESRRMLRMVDGEDEYECGEDGEGGGEEDEGVEEAGRRHDEKGTTGGNGMGTAEQDDDEGFGDIEFEIINRDTVFHDDTFLPDLEEVKDNTLEILFGNKNRAIKPFKPSLESFASFSSTSSSPSPSTPVDIVNRWNRIVEDGDLYK